MTSKQRLVHAVIATGIIVAAIAVFSGWCAIIVSDAPAWVKVASIIVVMFCVFYGATYAPVPGMAAAGCLPNPKSSKH